MGQSYRYLNDNALRSNKLLDPLCFLKESIFLITAIALVTFLILEIFTFLSPAFSHLPKYYFPFLCLAAYLLALVFNYAEYWRIIGDFLSYVFYSTFLISIFNLLIFSTIYFVLDNLTVLHAIRGFIIALLLTLLLSLFLLLREKRHQLSYSKQNSTYLVSFPACIKNGGIFMFYELSEHLQAWSVPIVLTMISEFSTIVEYRLAFRMLSLISFVPMIINSTFSITFGKLISEKNHSALKKAYHAAILKTGFGIAIAVLGVYIAYTFIKIIFLSSKYENLFQILSVLTIGHVICSLFEPSTLILNLQQDKRMLPFFLNLFVFLSVSSTGLILMGHTYQSAVFIVFSAALAIKGTAQFFVLEKKISKSHRFITGSRDEQV
jgi:O-antigen/teichoic acid export membrane protein